MDAITSRTSPGCESGRDGSSAAGLAVRDQISPRDPRKIASPPILSIDLVARPRRAVSGLGKMEVDWRH
jgi:hypothetical protein